MTDPKHIPSLIKLLDDESDDVRSNVMQELVAFGPNLQPQIEKFGIIFNNVQKQYIDCIFNDQSRLRLRQLWPGWFNIKDEHQKLEKALSILSQFLGDYKEKYILGDLLDQLAQEYLQSYVESDARLLAQFLFKKKCIKGDEGDYYNPQNSNLVHVIKKKKGIPISLASIYMLVGHRLGLHIEGCHFPGHFLARINDRGRIVFVDCFSGGQVIEQEDILNMRGEPIIGLEGILNERAPAETVIHRFLANLIRAYQTDEDEKNGQLMIDLFKDFDTSFLGGYKIPSTANQIINAQEECFRPGQVVCHTRYGYKGIIVELDDFCEATDDWYYSNQTQPERDQPWYHVLVDGSDQVTYVAESNLIGASVKGKIEHPLITYFFIKSKDGRYIRNDNPWPVTDF